MGILKAKGRVDYYRTSEREREREREREGQRGSEIGRMNGKNRNQAKR